MADQPSLTIPRDLIEPVIEAHVSAAIMSAMGDRADLLEKAVQLALYTKVDQQGRPSTYSDAIPYLRWLVNEAIRNAAKKAIAETVASNGEMIEKAIVKELKKDNSPLVRQLVAGMTTAFTNADNLNWRLTINLEERNQR